MDALRKLRESVSKQQQAVIKQFPFGGGYEASDGSIIDDRTILLEKLFKSTRTGKEFQRDVVRAAETFTVIGYKNIEAGTKLTEDCIKYGTENAEDNILAKSATMLGEARKNVDKEQEDYNKLLSAQVLEPLRATIATGSTNVEDARHLSNRYSRVRHEAEILAAELTRRQARVKEAPSAENSAKLQSSETKMEEMKKNLSAAGKEATDAISSIDSQQQRLTLQRLIAMVEGEKSFHLKVAAILGDVEAEMIKEKQLKESAPPAIPEEGFYLAEATHDFSADSDTELNLSKGDYVVVRKVSPSGWAEGECNGKAGWFPSAYVEKRDSAPSTDPPAEEKEAA